MNEELKKEEVIEPEVISTNNETTAHPSVDCKFTQDAYMSLNRETSKNMLYLVIILEVAIIAVSVLFFVTGQYLYGGVVAALAILYPFLVYYLNVVQLKKSYKMSKDVYETTNYHFEFKEKTILINVKFKKGDPMVRDYDYDKLFKIVENNKYFFLYIARNQAFVVNKETITENDLNTIRDYIRGNKVNFVQRTKTSK